MKLHYIFILFLAFTFGVKAQDNVADITALFSDATTVQWAVPISTKIIVPIEWPVSYTHLTLPTSDLL